MIDKIHMNYHGVINSGHTLAMAGTIDPWRMYCNKRKYETAGIGIYPDFNLPQMGSSSFCYAEYLLLKVDGNIDYNVLTSLN